MAEKKVLIMDENREQVNPASEETLMLLKRLVKILESNATVDSSNRQRVVVDSGAITATMTSTTITSLPVAVQFNYESQDRTRQSYALGIRANLSWS
jgi:hypothetical protein